MVGGGGFSFDNSFAQFLEALQKHSNAKLKVSYFFSVFLSSAIFLDNFFSDIKNKRKSAFPNIFLVVLFRPERFSVSSAPKSHYSD